MKKAIKTQFILFLVLLGSGVFAQDLTNPGGDPSGTAPIDDYIIPMLLIVFIFGYKILILRVKKLK